MFPPLRMRISCPDFKRRFNFPVKVGSLFVTGFLGFACKQAFAILSRFEFYKI